MARNEIHYEIGKVLPGTKYVVVRKLGRGGMGVVLEVVKEPGIRGVIKIIHPFLAAEKEFRRRFFDEVRILARLEHPNIVKVTDYDQLADGTPYFAMELLNGSTVRQLLRATGTIEGVHVYQIMRGLLEGLDYAHTHDPPIIHRDVKAENVFIHTPAFGDPCVKVIDFGVAGGDSIVEEKGMFVGTPRYAAPEQLRGQPVTPQTDLYAAALVLYEAIAGQGPFDDVQLSPADGGNRVKAFIRAHLTLEPPSVVTYAPWVPPPIDELLRSALAKDPAKRPQSAYAFAQKLYMLQFPTTPLTNNTTLQNLVTMAELSSVANSPESAAAQEHDSSAPATTRELDAAPAPGLEATVAEGGPKLQALRAKLAREQKEQEGGAPGAKPPRSPTVFERVAPGAPPPPRRPSWSEIVPEPPPSSPTFVGPTTEAVPQVSPPRAGPARPVASPAAPPAGPPRPVAGTVPLPGPVAAPQHMATAWPVTGAPPRPLAGTMPLGSEAPPPPVATKSTPAQPTTAQVQEALRAGGARSFAEAEAEIDAGLRLASQVWAEKLQLTPAPGRASRASTSTVPGRRQRDKPIPWNLVAIAVGIPLLVGGVVGACLLVRGSSGSTPMATVAGGTRGSASPVIKVLPPDDPTPPPTLAPSPETEPTPVPASRPQRHHGSHGGPASPTGAP